MVEVKRTGRRRVSTEPVAGSDPTPQDVPDVTPVRAAEDRDDVPASSPATRGENDDRLRQDKPPHW
ncbi:hypothetical protein [Herbiconiux solani]|uniref:hypothetical protein n=1 Tax=Herbiconiux solani TaxID=661329 RepID=UPI0008269B70|nr:hypothetical protein [Herbiconiux solani]